MSNGLFDDDMITVFGLPWCRDKPQKIALSRAVAKILCGKHNNALSVFDAEATKLSRFLAENIVETPLVESEIRLNGAYFEKWALKTFLNLGYLRGLHQDQPNRLEPRRDLIDYIFRDVPVADGVGLYFVSDKVTNERFKTGVSWNVIQNKERLEQVLGVVFVINGIQFIVSIPPVRAEQLIASQGQIAGFDYATATIAYRPEGFSLVSESAGRKRVYLSW